MKKYHGIILGGTLLLLVAGAGCQPPENSQEGEDEKFTPEASVEKQKTAEEPAEKDSKEKPTGEKTTATEKSASSDKESVIEKSATGINITKAEPGEAGILNVEFVVEKELAESAEAYILLLTESEEPTYPTQGYWYELGTAHTEKEWTNLPSGERYLRVCMKKNGECEIYSQTIKVEIE